MTSKEKQNENLYDWISGILGQISNGYPLQCSAAMEILIKFCVSNFYIPIFFGNLLNIRKWKKSCFYVFDDRRFS
jgi:hypothetical protein